MRADRAGSGKTAGAATGFVGAIAESDANRAAGRMALGPAHLDAAGAVHPGTLFGFAAEIARSAASRAGTALALIEAKSIVLAPGPARELVAEAEGQPGAAGSTVWTCTLRDETGRTQAVIAQTFLAAPRAADAVPEAAAEARPAAPRTTARSDSRRAQIARAASDVIAAKGFANATIREIADAAGLHVPTLYQYIGSKDELLELVYTHIMEGITEEFDAATASSRSAREALVQAFGALLAVSDRNRRYVGVLNREFKSLSPEGRVRVVAHYRGVLDRFARILETGTERGEFRPMEPFLVANFVEMFCDVWALRPFFTNAYRVEAFRDEALAFLLHGVAAVGGLSPETAPPDAVPAADPRRSSPSRSSR